MSAPLDPVEIVAEWLNLAKEDLATATDMVPKGRWRHVCFHAQQAAEKYLQGPLSLRGEPFHRTHDLEELQHLGEALAA